MNPDLTGRPVRFKFWVVQIAFGSVISGYLQPLGIQLISYDTDNITVRGQVLVIGGLCNLVDCC